MPYAKKEQYAWGESWIKDSQPSLKALANAPLNHLTGSEHSLHNFNSFLELHIHQEDSVKEHVMLWVSNDSCDLEH